MSSDFFIVSDIVCRKIVALEVNIITQKQTCAVWLLAGEGWGRDRTTKPENELDLGLLFPRDPHVPS